MIHLKMTSETGFSLEATNPDESLKSYARDRIRDAYNQEVCNFLQEVAVSLRRLKPGESITLQSKPIEVSLERKPETQTTKPLPKK